MPVEYAITVQQPWAQIIAEAEALSALGVEPKLVENRGRLVAAKYIGVDVAIHAGKTWDEAGARDPHVLEAWRVFAGAIGGDGAVRPDPLWFPTGLIVAVATLTGSHQTATPTCCQPWGWPLHYNGKPARHLTLANVRRLDRRVEVPGKQPVPWKLPPEITAELDLALAA